MTRAKQATAARRGHAEAVLARTTPTPEDLLVKATAARTPAARARAARQGLAARQPLDKTTQALLLRQLSLAHYEQQDFARARQAAVMALELGVLADVIHQDAARAAVGAGDTEAAVRHLRLAARLGP
ncbi:MAG: tetratricopeptide repeat protein, partial [Polyangiaceae bacterium]